MQHHCQNVQFISNHEENRQLQTEGLLKTNGLDLYKNVNVIKEKKNEEEISKRSPRLRKTKGT